MSRFTNYLVLIGCSLMMFLACCFNLSAQPGDTTENVEILNYTKRLTFKKIDDTTQVTIIAGNVKLRQGNAYLYCDSCVINDRTKIFEAWGNVHIVDGDTANIYAKHLRYLMRPKQAYLDGGVRLTDGHGTLTTPDLEYNMETNIGIYTRGGRVVNKKTILTSQEGWYYADLKDIYFKKNVLLRDPAYTIVTDSLLYNTESETTRFISQTTITDSSGRVVKTRQGYYNQKTGKAEFGERPTIVDPKEQIEITANTIESDDNSGISRAVGNAIVVDKKNKTTVIAGVIFRDKNADAMMAINKPLMILEQDNDSIYISADTLFSARLTDLVRAQEAAARLSGRTANTPDSAQNNQDSAAINDTSEIISGNPADTVSQRSLITKKTISPVAPTDTTKVLAGDVDTTVALRNELTGAVDSRDSLVIDTLKGTQVINLNDNDSTNRYFEAYRNVRIFSDSLQAVGDSMFYSFRDSIFRLYQDPVVWAKESQITGDTILLYTKNKKADQIKAFENSFLVNKLDPQAFNQIKSTRMDGYFINGDIDSVRARGFAECIYYVQDEDSAYTAINESKSDIMDIYFRNKELRKVVMRTEVTGTLWPIRQKSPTEMRLENFRWLDDRRPKSKFEMYE